MDDTDLIELPSGTWIRLSQVNYVSQPSLRVVIQGLMIDVSSEDGEEIRKRLKPTSPPGGRLADIEKQVILSTLERFKGHQIKTAKELGIGVRTLGMKLKKWREVKP